MCVDTHIVIIKRGRYTKTEQKCSPRDEQPPLFVVSAADDDDDEEVGGILFSNTKNKNNENAKGKRERIRTIALKEKQPFSLEW